MVKECLYWHRPIPDRIQNAPELWMGLELFFSAFFELNSCRPIGWTPGPIPWSIVQDYADTFDLDDEQTEDLHYFIRKMDEAFLKREANKAKNT